MLKAERYMNQVSRNNGLMTHCVIHKFAKAKESAFEPMSPIIQKVTHLVLAIRHGCCLKLYRAEVRELLDKVVIIEDEWPHPSWRIRNIATLDTLLPLAVQGNAVRRACILTLANGNWGR